MSNNPKPFSGKVKVYTLSDFDGNVFYVGITTQQMEVRLAGHLTEARCQSGHFSNGNRRKNDLIKSLDFKIQATIIELIEVSAKTAKDAHDKCRDREKFWIAKYAEMGHNLLNSELRFAIRKATVYCEKVGQVIKPRNLLST